MNVSYAVRARRRASVFSKKWWQPAGGGPCAAGGAFHRGPPRGAPGGAPGRALVRPAGARLGAHGRGRGTARARRGRGTGGAGAGARGGGCGVAGGCRHRIRAARAAEPAAGACAPTTWKPCCRPPWQAWAWPCCPIAWRAARGLPGL